MTYVVGFILATVFLHAAGISVGIITQRLHSSPRIARYAGAGIAVCGLLLCIH